MLRAAVGLALLTVLLGGAILIPGARAEHLYDHRYFVVGTVRNELGEPVCGVTVRAADIDKPFAESNRTAVTDASGGFSIQLHMHDSFDVEFNRQRPQSEVTVNDQIRVSVEEAGVAQVVRAEKNAGNPDGWGQKSADFFVDGLRSRCISPAQIALIGLGVVGALIVVIFAVRVLRRPGLLAGGANAKLLEIQGVGRARVRELRGFGIRSVEDLAAASPEELSAGTSLTPKQASLLVRRANEALGEKA